MLLLVGLGNPGPKYAHNRHNAGFHAVEAIADAEGFGPERKKFQGLVREGRIGTAKTMTLRPETYYNDAGNSVKAAVQFYKIDTGNVIVFHDEIDLAPGKLRLKKGGGLAGNRGLKSIDAHLGPDFWRVRIGIGHPGHKDKVTPFVLSDFSKAERADYLDDMLAGMGRAATHLAALDDASAGRFVSAILQPGAMAAAERKARAVPGHISSDLAIGPSEAGNRERRSPFDVLKSLDPRRKD